MLKTVVLLCFLIPLLKAIPFKLEAKKKPNNFFHAENPVKRIPDCDPGYSDSDGCQLWEEQGYCDTGSVYHDFMMETCMVACGQCAALPTTVPPTTLPPYSTPEKITFNTADCLTASNLNRTTRHGVPSLQWDDTLASESADWAIYLANKTTVSLEHSSGNYGENLFYKGSYPPGSLASCKDAVVAWYSEIDNYDFNNPGTSSNGKVIGHFTQVVWKSTTKVGVGIAAVTRPYNGNSFTFTFVVARYTPPGNYAGQYAENVPNVVSKK